MKLNYHDAPLEDIKFDFNSQSIILSLSIYIEESGSYDIHQLHFKEVDDIEFLLPRLNDVEPEIYTIEISEENDYKKASIIILLGFSKPSLTLNFKFKKYELILKSD